MFVYDSFDTALYRSPQIIYILILVRTLVKVQYKRDTYYQENNDFNYIILHFCNYI